MSVNPEINFDIKNLTTFKTGGKIAEVFFPENIEECLEILSKNPEIPVFGNLSNTLISTDGFAGKLILTTKMNTIHIEGTKVIADCGVKGPMLSQEVCKAGLSGLEFMIGFPGSVGGEVYMNASANSQAISEKIVSVTCYSSEFGLKKYSKDEMNFGYRSSRCQTENLIVLQAEFELEPKEVEAIKKQMDENLTFRRTHQPSLALPNCGSIFKNPEGNSAGRLLDSVGAKEMKSGGARVWENHANFIVNDNNGSSEDILNLMLQMQNKVKEEYNIKLKPEIIFFGNINQRENELWKTLSQK